MSGPRHALAGARLARPMRGAFPHGRADRNTDPQPGYSTTLTVAPLRGRGSKRDLVNLEVARELSFPHGRADRNSALQPGRVTTRPSPSRGGAA